MSVNELTNSVNIQIDVIQFGSISFPSDSCLEVNYVNGKKEGEGLVLSSKKTRLAQLNFHEDKLEGTCVLYDSEGRKEKACVFHADEITEVCEYSKGRMSNKFEFDGKIMKEYAKERIVYEGEFAGDLSKGFVRNGRGIVYNSSNDYYCGVFTNNVEERQISKCSGNEMIEYNDKGGIVYKGGFKKKGSVFERRGIGVLYEYNNDEVSEVYKCNDGVKSIKKLTFVQNEMIEYDDNGLIVYKGGYQGNRYDECERCGIGEEFNEDDVLVYSGGWKNGKKEGNGILYDDGEIHFEGMWKNGKPNGYGKCYNDNGVVMKQGVWKNGYLQINHLIRFNYSNRRYKMKIDMKWIEDILPIHEIKKLMKDERVVCGLIIIILLLLLFPIYYLYCVLRINPVIHNGFEMNHIGFFVKTIVVNSDVESNIESVVIESMFIDDYFI